MEREPRTVEKVKRRLLNMRISTVHISKNATSNKVNALPTTVLNATAFGHFLALVVRIYVLITSFTASDGRWTLKMPHKPYYITRLDRKNSIVSLFLSVLVPCIGKGPGSL